MGVIRFRRPLFVGAMFLWLQMTFPWILAPARGFFHNGKAMYLLTLVAIVVGYWLATVIFTPNKLGNIFVGVGAGDRTLRVLTLFGWAVAVLYANRFALSQLDPPAADGWPTVSALFQMTVILIMAVIVDDRGTGSAVKSS